MKYIAEFYMKYPFWSETTLWAIAGIWMFLVMIASAFVPWYLAISLGLLSGYGLVRFVFLLHDYIN